MRHNAQHEIAGGKNDAKYDTQWKLFLERNPAGMTNYPHAHQEYADEHTRAGNSESLADRERHGNIRMAEYEVRSEEKSDERGTDSGNEKEHDNPSEKAPSKSFVVGDRYPYEILSERKWVRKVRKLS